MTAGYIRAAAAVVVASLAACSEGTSTGDLGPSKFEEDFSFGVSCAGSEQRLVRDRASWEGLWAQTHPDGEPVPHVDFATDSVIAVCGTFNHGEWYEITAWEPAASGRVTVHDTRVGLGSNCVGLLVLTSGFHAVRIEGTYDSAEFVTRAAGREACTSDDALRIDKPPGWMPLADDYFSGCTGASDRVIRNDEDWAAFWTLVHANLAEEPARPAVDFANESVIATCLGDRQDGGFATRIRHMTDPDAEAQVVVGVLDYVAAADCGEDALAPTYQAYHMIRVNRPLAGATFRRRTSMYSCAAEAD